MVSKKSVGVSGMDNSGTQSVMDDRCGDKKKEVDHILDKEVVVNDKITKLPGLPIGVTVKRGIVGLMDGGIDDQSYEIGDKVSIFIEYSGLPPSNIIFQEIYNLINSKTYTKLPTWIKEFIFILQDIDYVKAIKILVKYTMDEVL